MTTDNSVAYGVLAERIKRLGEYRDTVKELAEHAETLPEKERIELLKKVGRIADILASEIEQLIAWNRENITKH